LSDGISCLRSSDTKDGIVCHIQAVGDLNMVMIERDNLWIRLIGKMLQDDLVNVARRIHF